MYTRPCLILLTLATAGLPAVAAAQATTGSSAAAASPYTQQRNPGYTSFDNPYAPGGIYDPYRSSRALSQGQNRGSTLFSDKTGADSGKPGSSLSHSRGLDQDDSLGGSSLQSAGRPGGCSGNSRLGGSSLAGGSALNRSASGSYAGGSTRCSGSSAFGSAGGYGSTLSGSSRSRLGAGGLSNRGLNNSGLNNSRGTAAGMQQQQMDRLQQLPQ